MDRLHYATKFGWEALSTASLAVFTATLVGILLTHTIGAIVGGTTIVVSGSLLGLSIYQRAGLQAWEEGDG